MVLAAGASRRLGEPKQLAMIGGERLLERAVRVAQEAGCAPVIVVLGAGAEGIARVCDLRGAQVVLNGEWEEGMASALRVGIAALPAEVDAAVVLTCDQPAVTAGHLRLLMERGARGEMVASCYAGRRGVPAYFPAAYFAQLRRMKGDTGARGLLESVTCVELEGGEVDVDTADTLAEARRLYG